LAFCSGPFLKTQGRQLYPPSDLWKQVIHAPSGFMDTTIAFEDDLGLPQSVDLSTTNNIPVMQYRVAKTTNVLGWEFPLEFYLAQYRPARTHGWELNLSARGKLSSVGILDSLPDR
jgi:hypothetical protein